MLSQCWYLLNKIHGVISHKTSIATAIDRRALYPALTVLPICGIDFLEKPVAAHILRNSPH